ncbi:MAG: lactonase family protein [Verrucomicrobiota bacterium]
MMNCIRWINAAGLAGVLGSALPAFAGAGAGLEGFYIGTYTGTSKGIYQATLDPGAGSFGPTNLAVTATDPSFLAFHPNHKYVYAVSESGGTVAAYSIDPVTKKLTFLNQLSSNGGAPCHLAVDNAGKSVFVSNYNGGSLTVLSIGSDGRLGAQTAHDQHTGTGPLVHCAALDASNQFVLVCDKGLDRVYSYRFNAAQGTLATNNPPWTTVAAGSGPRHIAFDPSFHRAYVICELSSTVIGFNYDSTNGTLSQFQTISTLPSGWSGQNTGAEIAVHPSGKYVYGSNRGHNSIVVYSVDPATGTLTRLQHQPVGTTPRQFAIDPTGQWCLVANQDSNNVLLYSIDPVTGLLTVKSTVLTLSKPVCILPFFITPPQPAVGMSDNGDGTLQLNLQNAFSSLTTKFTGHRPCPPRRSGICWRREFGGRRTLS